MQKVVLTFFILHKFQTWWSLVLMFHDILKARKGWEEVTRSQCITVDE